jgi:hypothetical protein
MGNMAYCMFENTLHDLIDCREAMQFEKKLSESERKALDKMVEVCQDIIDEYEYYSDDENADGEEDED